MNDQPRPRFDLIAIAIGLCVFCMVCVGAVAIVFRNPTTAPRASSTPIQESILPLSSSTPEITPTPVPLPIREDFDKQFSSLWSVIGDPLVLENVELGTFSGVLTNRYGETS